jgi:hypothetical protein
VEVDQRLAALDLDQEEGAEKDDGPHEAGDDAGTTPTETVGLLQRVEQGQETRRR